MSTTTSLTRERLLALLSYAPRTGVFRWRVARRGPAVVGSIAGCIGSIGYRVISIDDKIYLAHRLAFLYMTGCWPQQDVDHRNRKRHDNRWSNLRDVSRSVNICNMKGPMQGAPFRGVSWLPSRGKYNARLTLRGSRMLDANFDTLDEAIATREQAREFWHGGY